MDTISWGIFLHLVEVKKRKELLRFLGPTELETVQTIPRFGKGPIGPPLSVEKRLARIHYSWLVPFFQSFMEKDKELLIASLNPFQKNRLKTYFKIENPLVSPKKEAREYMIEVVYRWVISGETELLPIEFLPDHPLNSLVHLNKKELQTLVDYLGLCDLGMELKQVVHSKQIKNIEKALSKDQKEYLKHCMAEKQSIAFARLNLDQWGGDEIALKRVLHNRGFNRLAKALFGCHPSLLWHLCHRLDTGRAKMLCKFLIDVKNEEVRTILIEQTVHLIKRIEKMQIE